jgi:hypothetical protein
MDTLLLWIIAVLMVIEFIERHIGIFLMLKGMFVLAKVPQVPPANAEPNMSAQVPHVRTGYFEN